MVRNAKLLAALEKMKKTVRNNEAEYPPSDEKSPSTEMSKIKIPDSREIFLKDESTHRWSGTHKDRMAWEVVVSYLNLLEAMLDDRISHRDPPQFSIISSGSAAIAIGRILYEYGLPPLKVISDNKIGEDEKLCNAIVSSNCELYLHDLKKNEMSSEDILSLTNNQTGFDLTAFQNVTRAMVNYDWLCYEILNYQPDFIFVPYGSGTLFRELLHTLKSSVSIDIRRDMRLGEEIDIKRLRRCSVLGATTNNPDSFADKLYAPYRPYHTLNLHEIHYYRTCGYCGERTGVYTIREEKLKQAYDTAMKLEINCEPSGSAGLALFLQMEKTIPIPQDSRIVVVNTGKLKLDHTT